MKTRPTIVDIIMEVLSFITVVGTTLYLIISWGSLPDTIPMHYDLSGEIDRWGNKGELIFLPVMMWIIYLGITLMQRFPQIWNTGVTVTPENRERVYRTLKYMVESLKLIVVVDFSLLTIFSATGRNLPVWFTFVFLGVLAGDLVFWLVRLVRRR